MGELSWERTGEETSFCPFSTREETGASTSCCSADRELSVLALCTELKPWKFWLHPETQLPGSKSVSAMCQILCFSQTSSLPFSENGWNQGSYTNCTDEEVEDQPSETWGQSKCGRTDKRRNGAEMWYPDGSQAFMFHNSTVCSLWTVSSRVGQFEEPCVGWAETLSRCNRPCLSWQFCTPVHNISMLLV